MHRRAFLSGSASALVYALGCRRPLGAGVADAPDPAEIHYADPWVPPPHVDIPAGWIEHRGAHPSPSAAYAWADVVLEACARDITLSRAPRVTVISRYMAVAFTAMFDAWAAYDDVAVGTRLGGTLRRPAGERTLENKVKAIGSAAYVALWDLFPRDRDQITNRARSLGVDLFAGGYAPASPEAVGRAAATAVTEYRHHDGANALGDEDGSDGTPYSDYTFYEPRNPVGTTNDADRWQPINFDDGNGGVVAPGFLTPHWYRVKLLALDRADQFRPGPQPKVGSVQLRREVEEVIGFNGGLSLEQKSIVEFMRDGPSSTGQSGHWLEFARDVSRRDRHDLDRDVKLFFAIANTASEAFVAAWDAKRFYDSARPFALVRVVHQLFAGATITGYLGPGKGFGPIRAADWHPYSPGTFVTPPFPGYVSGHSTVSGACAKMLELFTGSDRFGVYHHHTAGMYTEPDADVAIMQSRDGVRATGLPADKQVVLALPTFDGVADMAGISRVMGGYHIQTDNVEGLKLGRRVAAFEWPRYQAYFDGTATIRS